MSEQSVDEKLMIGRQVVYCSRGSADGVFPPVERTATITAVTSAGELGEELLASLVVFNPTGLFFDQDVPYSSEPKPGHWSWPYFKRTTTR